MAVNQLIKSAMQCPLPSPRFAYMAPLYKQAKAIAWDYMRQYAGVIPDTAFLESELRVDLPGDRRIRLFGADNPEALRGIYLDGVVLDEYAYMDPDVWRAAIRPMLVDRQGFAMFLGTPLGRNHFLTLYEKAQASGALTMLYRASETGVVPKEELDLARREMGEDLYAQEFECSFEAAIRGAYYARELEAARAQGRIKPVPWEPALPVETWWDLGYSDRTAMLYTQRVGRELHLIDYDEDYGKDLAFYAKRIQTKPYLYGVHHLPHDAGHHELGSGRTLEQQLRDMNVKPTRVHPKNDPLHGISQGRLLFPRCWFDSVKCARLLDALASYRSDWDDKRQDFKDEPKHDWASHGADAFRLLAVNHRESAERTEQKYAKTAFDPFALGPRGNRYAVSNTREW